MCGNGGSDLTGASATRNSRNLGESPDSSFCLLPYSLDSMDFFNYKNKELYCENDPAARIAAEVGTPDYVYSKATLLHHYRQVADAFKTLNPTICYSIKSCSNLHVCKLLIDAGC